MGELGHINNLYNTTFWALVQKGGMGTMEAEELLKVFFPLLFPFPLFLSGFGLEGGWMIDDGGLGGSRAH